MSINFYRTTTCHIPEDNILNVQEDPHSILCLSQVTLHIFWGQKKLYRKVTHFIPNALFMEVLRFEIIKRRGVNMTEPFTTCYITIFLFFRSMWDPLSCVHKSRQIVSHWVLLGTLIFMHRKHQLNSFVDKLCFVLPQPYSRNRLWPFSHTSPILLQKYQLKFSFLV